MQDETRITIRIPGSIKDWLDRVRHEEGCSLNYQIIRALKIAHDQSEKATEHQA